MVLESLRVVHLRKNGGTRFDDRIFADTFSLETCQRRIWVYFTHHKQLSEYDGAEIFCGSAAYRFLLRIACGLESDIQGETEVFGQFKQAWSLFERSNSKLVADLRPWINRIFEDVKFVRTNFLQSIGGASYGSLVRSILRKHSTHETSSKPLLLVGAGKIAHSVAPWLLDYELWLTNRSREPLENLFQELISKAGTNSRIQIVRDNEEQAWINAGQAVICIPVDSTSSDCQRIKSWNDNEKCLIHLGCSNDNLGAWAGLHNFYCLDDIFALKREQNEVRFSKIAQAANACDEQAKMRASCLTLQASPVDLASVSFVKEQSSCI